jgi:hypothetical protein
MLQRIPEATALGLPVGSEEEDFRMEARRKRAGRTVSRVGS